MTDITQVEISRRNFIKGILGLAAAMGIPNLPTIDELPPIPSIEDTKDEILEWAVDDSIEETITIKQSDNYIGTIRIDNEIYPLLSVDIAWRRERATLMGYEYPPETSIDFLTDITILAVPSSQIADIELSVTGAQLAMRGKGYLTGKTGWKRFSSDFYLWNCEVQLIGEPEFVT